MSRSSVVLLLLIGLTAVVYFIRRPITDPTPIDGTAVPKGEYEVVWTFEPPSRTVGPAGFDPVLFLGYVTAVAVARAGDGPPRGVVYGFDHRTGVLKWTFDAGGTLAPTSVGPACGPYGGSLLVADGPGGANRLFALREEDGSVQWELRAADRVRSTPGYGGDTAAVSVAAGDDGVYLVEPKSGKVLWHFRGGHVNARPSGEFDHPRGRMFVATSESPTFPSSELLALNPTTGDVEWRSPLPAPGACGDPWINKRVVIVPLTDGLAAFDRVSGERKWQRKEAGPVVAESQVLRVTGLDPHLNVSFGTGDGLLRVVNTETGRALWTAALGSPVAGPPEMSGQWVWAATRDGRLFEFNFRTCKGDNCCDTAPLLGGRPTVLAAQAGTRAVLVAEVDGPDGRMIRVVELLKRG